MEFLPYFIFMLLVAIAVAVTTFGITTWVYMADGNDEPADKKKRAEPAHQGLGS